MRKRTAPARARPKAESKFSVKRGEKVEFPVSARHPLARFQTLTPVRKPEDIADFVPLWEKVAASRDHPPPTVDDVVKELRKGKASVLHLHATDLQIARGAVLTLNNPLNRLSFENITIAGDLVSTGELVLVCDNLTLD